VYAPNVPEPIDVHLETSGGDARVPVEGLVLSGCRRHDAAPAPSARVPLEW